MLQVVIFHGTVRKGQSTYAVTKLVEQVASQNKELEINIADPRNLQLSFDDEGGSASPPELTKLVAKADAYIIVAPEYNHSFPGSLKYLLDLNLKEYIHKPVAFVGVSAGPFGGSRVIESLLNVVRELGMVACFTDVNLSKVQAEFNDNKVIDLDKWSKRIEKMMTELVWMAQALKQGRDSIPSQYHKSTGD